MVLLRNFIYTCENGDKNNSGKNKKTTILIWILEIFTRNYYQSEVIMYQSLYYWLELFSGLMEDPRKGFRFRMTKFVTQ